MINGERHLKKDFEYDHLGNQVGPYKKKIHMDLRTWLGSPVDKLMPVTSNLRFQVFTRCSTHKSLLYWKTGQKDFL